MPFLLVDDGWGDHPKIVGLTMAQRGLWITIGVWCAKHPQTEGFVPRAAMSQLASQRGSRLASQLRPLVVSHLLHRDDELDGWWMHDWTDYNPDADQVQRRRSQWSESQRRRRAAGARNAARDDTTGQYVSSVDRPNVSTATPSPTPTRTSTGLREKGYPQAVETVDKSGRSRGPADPRATVPANLVLEERTRRRIDGQTCPTCADVGMVESPVGAHPCPDCRS